MLRGIVTYYYVNNLYAFGMDSIINKLESRLKELQKPIESNSSDAIYERYSHIVTIKYVINQLKTK